MNKSEIINKLEKLFTKPKVRLNEKLGGNSRSNIWKWWTDPERSSETIEAAALELIKEGELAKEALEAISDSIKL